MQLFIGITLNIIEPPERYYYAGRQKSSPNKINIKKIKYLLNFISQMNFRRPLNLKNKLNWLQLELLEAEKQVC